MKCHCKNNCIQEKESILNGIEHLYQPCSDCFSKKLKKAIPLKRQIKLSKINKDYCKCESCGKRHIDLVMAHALKILIEERQISESASIRQVGVPLITPAIFLDKLPYISEKSLVIITTFCDKQTAVKIIEEVPEIKAIIKGDTNITVGKINENESITNYELLGGCDIRCDIHDTDLGPVLIYKNQSKLHIEYPKDKSQKILQLSEILEKYENPKILDAMCGSGTLGIYALMKNAKRVVFNDIYSEALDSLKVNLNVNQINENTYEILNENLHDLPKILDEKFDIGIIDTFPNNDTTAYVNSLMKLCDEIIII